MKIRWQAWYDEHEIKLDFPEGWKVERAGMAGAPTASWESLVHSFNDPIGTPPLRELAAGSRSAVLVVEDITRPTPTEPLVSLILAELACSGLKAHDVRIVIGQGAHAPMRRAELMAKLGERAVARHAIYHNHVHENQEHLGTSSYGTPIYVSRFYLEADLRISLGGIVPHGFAGYGGGAKTVAIGVGGIETLHANHKRLSGRGSMVGRTDDNDQRLDMEEIARVAGHRFIVNAVLNERRELAGLFAGDPVLAHRAGAKYAHQVYATKIPDPADVAVLNAYPKDTDLMQLGNALSAVGRDLRRAMKPDGSAVLVSACPQGQGAHYLEGVGMRGHAVYSRSRIGLGERGLIICSPNLSPFDIIHTFPEDTVLLHSWREVLEELIRRHGKHASVTVFPCGSLQMPASAIA